MVPRVGLSSAGVPDLLCQYGLIASIGYHLRDHGCALLRSYISRR